MNERTELNRLKPFNKTFHGKNITFEVWGWKWNLYEIAEIQQFFIFFQPLFLLGLKLGSYVVEASLMATFNAYEGIIINWLMDCKVVVR